MSNYLGETVLAGLTPSQIAAIEAACSAAPPSCHDGLWRSVAANLGFSGSHTDIEVQAAIVSAKSDNGVPISILHPCPIADTANLNGGGVCGGSASQKQTNNPSLLAAAAIVAAILGALQLLTGGLAANGGLGCDIAKA
jgi:hypothetical protein